MAIKVICDSPADIPKPLAEELGIHVVPMPYSFDGENYLLDGVDLSIDEFFDRMRTGKQMPKTSQITFQRWKEAFLEYIDDTILCVTMSSVASGTCQNAMLAREELLEEHPGADITVIDSMSFSYAYGCAVVEGARLAKDGADKETVIAKIQDTLKKVVVYFLVEELTWLQKGGRINMATVLVANLMDIRPVLSIENGLVVGIDKIRGKKGLYQKFMKLFEKKGFDGTGKPMTLIHSLNKEQFAALKQEAEAFFQPSSTMEVPLGSIIGCHAGPGLSGIMFIKD